MKERGRGWGENEWPRTSLACSRVNLARGRRAGAGAGVSGSVRTVTWELSTAEVSKTEDVSGEAERWRVVAVVDLVVDDEGRDLDELALTTPSKTQRKQNKKQHTLGLASSLGWSKRALFAAGSVSACPSVARDAMPGVGVGVGVGERRFLDCASNTEDGALDNTRIGDVAAARVGRGGTALALAGLCPASLPSCLALGEHALGSRAPSTRRLTGDASILGA